MNKSSFGHVFINIRLSYLPSTREFARFSYFENTLFRIKINAELNRHALLE